MVKPKKHLGQHFLKDESISKQIALSISYNADNFKIIEVGPGTGALTKFLLERKQPIIAYEVDKESVAYLALNYPDLEVRNEDFLKLDFTEFANQKIVVVGNFPYNISSQILFKILEEKQVVQELVGMFQKEVATRVVQQPGTKSYGILSVLIQAYYYVEYLFTVDEHVFNPPPKVKSGVIRIKRNALKQLPCNEELFKRVVKATFNQRRKMIRNTVRSFVGSKIADHHLFTKRPEQLSVNDFVELTNFLESL